MSVISGSTNTVLGTIPVGGSPFPPTYDPANKDLYVPNANSANVSVIAGAPAPGNGSWPSILGLPQW